MRLPTYILLLLTIIILSCQVEERENTLDLESYDLEQYDYLTEIPLGSNLGFKNRTNKTVALGRLLFYDNLLALNQNVSCGSCHQQSKAFADNLTLSRGLFLDETSRNTQSLAYAGFQGRFFWDGRSRDIEEAVLEPIMNHSEMAMPNIELLIERLNETEHYPKLFEEAFGSSQKYDYNGEITGHLIGTSMAEFIESLYNFDSPYDFGFQNEFTNFSKEELNGMKIFEEKGKCQSCHLTYLFGTYYGTTNIGLYDDYADKGSGSGRFRVPSLRNIEVTGPYMHDGSIETLEEVVEHYNSGIKNHPNLSWHLTDQNKNPIKLNLSEEEKSDLVAFLKTLTDQSLLYDERFSNPFR